MRQFNAQYGRFWHIPLRPEDSCLCESVSLDRFSRAHVVLTASRRSRLASGVPGILEVLGQNTSLGFIAVEVTSVSTSTTTIEMRCRTSGAYEQLLASPIVAATYESGVTRWPVTPTAIRLGLASGALTRAHESQLVVCPHCRDLPNLSVGCGVCGSSDVTEQTLIHHYRCAAVAPQCEFQDGDTIACPKCSARDLVVGVDFELLAGRQVCCRCGHKMDEVELFGHCIGCSTTFSPRDAPTVRLPTYRTRSFNWERISEWRRVDTHCIAAPVGREQTSSLQPQP